MIDGHTFALCLTHDVDRPFKRLHHACYYALQDRSPSHLRSILGGENPYWQFEIIRALESDLDVRSAFYVLDEPHLWHDLSPREWLDADNWVQQLGRYDPTASPMAQTLRNLDDAGWEIGVHGSYHTATDPERMATEKVRIESILGHPTRGIRQHYLRLEAPDTWHSQSQLGFEYDASLGSGTEYGFRYGYGLLRPIEEPLLVFPLTLMEQALPDPAADFERAWEVCEDLLLEAAENGAVMSVLWHPRYFSEQDFPGYRELYRRLVERAFELGGWVGSPGGLLDRLDSSTLEELCASPSSLAEI